VLSAATLLLRSINNPYLRGLAPTVPHYSSASSRAAKTLPLVSGQLGRSLVKVGNNLIFRCDVVARLGIFQAGASGDYDIADDKDQTED
jgi:hypothetical protein